MVDTGVSVAVVDAAELAMRSESRHMVYLPAS
jgi:hypothetical protein